MARNKRRNKIKPQNRTAKGKQQAKRCSKRAAKATKQYCELVAIDVEVRWRWPSGTWKKIVVQWTHGSIVYRLLNTPTVSALLIIIVIIIYCCCCCLCFYFAFDEFPLTAWIPFAWLCRVYSNVIQKMQRRFALILSSSCSKSFFLFFSYKKCSRFRTHTSNGVVHLKTTHHFAF